MGSILLLLFLLSFTFSDFISEAYDPLDPYGNITIKWDIQSWTTSGYAAIVTLFNYQQYRHIQEPGWELGWTWAKKEVIWNVMGGQTTEQGDCSNFKGEFIPHCCLKNPTIVDLLPGAPYNLRTTNCCKGGVLSSLLQDPANYVSSFQLFIGAAGTTNKTVRLPKHFTLNAPGPGYTCGPAKKVEPTRYASPDGRRVTQAMMTWTVTCTYSQFLAQRTPTCCVSFSAFYNKNIVPCLRCACGCQDNRTNLGSCVDPNLPYSASIVPETTETNYAPLVRCTSHMCPVRIHWHVMRNYQEYWRVKVTVTNFNYRMNYTQWNMVIQHPNFENLTQTFSLDYKPLNHYESINDTALLYGVKFYNDLLMQAGPSGFVQSELLFRKDKPSFTFEGGWAFPRRVYFNGDDCVMPPPNVYPYLPNSSLGLQISLVTLLTTLFLALAFFHSFI